MMWFFCDPGGIQTPNPQSRNLMRYSVAPRSHLFSVFSIQYSVFSIQYSVFKTKILDFLSQIFLDNRRNHFTIGLTGQFFGNNAHDLSHVLHSRCARSFDGLNDHFFHFFLSQLLR